MIYRVLARNDQGDEVDVADVSAELLKESAVVFICPMEGEISRDGIAHIQRVFDRAGIKAIVSGTPLQLYQIVLPESHAKD